MSQRDLIWEVNRRFGVLTSRMAIRTALNSKNIIEASMENATKAEKRTRVVSDKGSDFESLLDSTLKKNFVKRNLNADVAIYRERVGKDHRGIWFGRAIVGQGCRGRFSAASCN